MTFVLRRGVVSNADFVEPQSTGLALHTLREEIDYRYKRIDLEEKLLDRGSLYTSQVSHWLLHDILYTYIRHFGY